MGMDNYNTVKIIIILYTKIINKLIHIIIFIIKDKFMIINFMDMDNLNQIYINIKDIIKMEKNMEQDKFNIMGKYIKESGIKVNQFS